MLLLFIIYMVAGDNVNMAGFDLENSRNFPSGISTKNIAKLNLKWNVSLCGSATSPPMVREKERITCVGDYGNPAPGAGDGCISCFNTDTGALINRRNMTSYGFRLGTISRITPTYINGLLILATNNVNRFRNTGPGAWIFAVDMHTLDLVWKTQVTFEPWAIFTSSPVVDEEYVYIGISSGESSWPVVPGYVCCQSFGTVYKIESRTGIIRNSVPMIAEGLEGRGKFTGCQVWGGMALHLVCNDEYKRRDIANGCENDCGCRKILYVGTGQNYAVTNASYNCILNDPTDPLCVPRPVLVDSIVKIDMSDDAPVGSQAILATFRMQASDTWNIACIRQLGLPGCQFGVNDDFDITNVMISTGPEGQERVIASSKSGFVWVFDLDLNYIWSSSVGVGDFRGNYVYQGALRDARDLKDVRFFLPNNNGPRGTITLLNGTNITNGLWISYDGVGNIKWMTPCPLNDTAFAPVALTNDILFGATRTRGLIVAMNANTGAILWSFQTAGSMSSGCSITGSSVYYPTGPGSLSLAPGLVD